LITFGASLKSKLAYSNFDYIEMTQITIYVIPACLSIFEGPWHVVMQELMVASYALSGDIPAQQAPY
jgi:hypothetical protein